MTLDAFNERLYAAQDSQSDALRLTRLTIAVGVLGDAVAGLEARIAHLEATRPAPAQFTGEVDPLRLLDLSEFARRAGFARATVGKMRDTLPIIDLPSGKGTLPFIREVDAIQWLEDHKRKVTP